MARGKGNSKFAKKDENPNEMDTDQFHTGGESTDLEVSGEEDFKNERIRKKPGRGGLDSVPKEGENSMTIDEENSQGDTIQGAGIDPKTNPTQPETTQDLKYNSKDKGPFVVMLEKPNINLLATSKEICKLVGTQNVQEIRQLGKNTLKLTARNYATANRVLSSTSLNKFLKIKTYVPRFYLLTTGIIDNVPADFDLNEILKEMDPAHQAVKIERMKKMSNGSLVDMDKIKVEFRSYELPRETRIYGAIFRIRLFIPRPTFCTKCLSYGHSKKSCRNQERCQNCSKEITEEHTKDCSEKCKFCVGPLDQHRTNARCCPETMVQAKIKKLMTTKKCGYNDAKKIVEDDELFPKPMAPTPSQIHEKTLADVSNLNRLCDQFKERVFNLIKMSQLVTKIAFSNDISNVNIVENIRNILDENQTLFVINEH